MSEDVYTVAQKIEDKIKEISDMRELVEPSSTRKANAIKNLKSKIAIAVVKIKAGVMTEFEGVEIKGKSDMFAKIVAEGYASEEYFEKVEAEESYKGLIARMEAASTELNGLQSIHKRLV